MSSKKTLQDVDEYMTRWNRLKDLIGTVVLNQKVTPDIEREFLLLSGDVAQRIPLIVYSLSMDKNLVQKVVDFLEDVYSLKIFLGMQEFQVSLLRERWNSITLDINAASSKIV